MKKIRENNFMGVIFVFVCYCLHQTASSQESYFLMEIQILRVDKLDNSTDFSRIPKYYSRLDFSRIPKYFSRLDFNRIPKYFSRLEIRCSSGSKNNFIPGNALTNLTKFLQLKMINCGSVRTDSDFVEIMQKLNTLELKNSFFPDIFMKGAPYNFPNITDLTLDEYTVDKFPDVLCLIPRLRILRYELDKQSFKNLNCVGTSLNLESLSVDIKFPIFLKVLHFNLTAFNSSTRFRDFPKLKSLSIRITQIYVIDSIPNSNDFSLIEKLQDRMENGSIFPIKLLNKVEVLEIFRIPIYSLTFQFRLLPQLRSLILVENNIHRLGSNCFKHCFNLESIDLSTNHISTVYNIFRSSDLPNLKSLNLEKNIIFRFDYMMIPRTLISLNIGTNPLKTLHDTTNICSEVKLQSLLAKWISFDYVDDLCFPPSIQEILLFKIRKLTVKTFSPLKYLKEFHLKKTKEMERFALSSANGNRNPVKIVIIDQNEKINCSLYNLLLSSLQNDDEIIAFLQDIRTISVQNGNNTEICQYFMKCKKEKIISNTRDTNIILKTSGTTDCGYLNLTKIPSNLNLFSTVIYLDGNNLSFVHLDEILEKHPSLEILFLNNSNIRGINISISHDNLNELHLEKNHIEELPRDIFLKLNILKSISLQNNSLTTFSVYLENLATDHPLSYLNLQFNRVKEIDNKICQNNIQYLYLQNNEIPEVRSMCGEDGNDRLIEIFLQDNKITLLEKKCFTNLEALKELHLERNWIQEIRDYAFNDLPKLKRLFLQRNRIEKIGNIFNNIVELEELYLQENLIHHISLNLFKELYSLKVLHLNENRILTLSSVEFYGSRNMITELHFENNFIKRISMEVFYNLPALAKLYLNQNNISEIIPVPYINFEKLEEFHLENNQIQSLNGTVFTGMRKLKYLFLNNNRISYLSVDIFYNNKELIELHLEGNLLKQITLITFNNLESLVFLYLNNNSISDIVSSSFVNLSHLRELHLGNNHLSLLNGDEFSGLFKLEKLFLNHNNIKSISTNTFKAMTALELLTLHNNSLKTPYIWDYGLSNRIKNLTLHSNPLLCDCKYLRELRNRLNSMDFISKNFSEKCFINEQKTSTEEYLNEQCDTTRVIIISLSVVLGLSLLITFFCVLMYRYRTEIQVFLFSRYGIRFFYDEAMDEGKQFDCFVAYSYSDAPFVANELVPRLEKYRLCLHDRHFIVGAFVADNIINSVNNSCCTIIVLTRTFARSEWCRMEFRAAHHKTLLDRCRRLIVIVKEDVPEDDMEEEMKLYLKTNTYLPWDDNLFWEKLYFSLPPPKESENQSTNDDISLEQINSVNI